MGEAPKKGTLGEELFMVHLSRMSDKTEDDFDSEFKQTHTPQTTLGESLWQVHLKRSAGLEDEPETEDNVKTKRSSRKKSRSERFPEASSNVAEATSPRPATSRTLNLRNRKVTIT